MKKALLLVFALPFLTSTLYSLVEKTEAQRAEEKAQEERAKIEQERKDRDEQARRIQETAEEHLQRETQEQTKRAFNTSLEGLNRANKDLTEIANKLSNVTTETVALVLQQLREARKNLADAQKTYDAAKESMIKANLKTVEPEKPGQMNAAQENHFAKQMAQEPEAFAQLLADNNIRNFIVANAHKNPALWRLALQKQYAYLEKRPDLPSTKKFIADLTHSVLLQSLEATKANRGKNDVLKEQIELIKGLNDVGLTYSSTQEITRIISVFDTKDFNTLAPEQIAILTNAASQMLKNPTPQPWYGLFLMSNIIVNGNDKVVLTKEISNTIQTKVTEALDKSIPFGGTKYQGKQSGLLGEYVINQITSAAATTDVVTLLEELIEIAKKYPKIFLGNDIRQLRNFLKAKQSKLAKKKEQDEKAAQELKKAIQTSLPQKQADTKKTPTTTLKTITEEEDITSEEEVALMKIAAPLGNAWF